MHTRPRNGRMVTVAHVGLAAAFAYGPTAAALPPGITLAPQTAQSRPAPPPSPIAPVPTSGVILKPVAGGLNIAWYGAKGAVQFELMRTDDTTKPPIRISTVPSTTLGSEDYNLGPSPVYYYQVVTVAANGSRAATAFKKFVVPAISRTAAVSVSTNAAPPRSTVPLVGSATTATPASFYSIQVTVLDPSSARVDWGNFAANPKASTVVPVNNYQVWRTDLPGQPIAKLSATTMTYTDRTLHDAKTYSYYVTANPAPQVTQRITGTGTVAGQTSQVTNNNPLPLGTSNSVSVTTPQLQPPTGVAALVAATAPNTVKVSWTPAAYAQSYQLRRDGHVVGLFSGTASDVPPAGWHDYQVESVLPEQGSMSVSKPSQQVSAHTGPLTILIVGGSFVWGEGLLTANKIATGVGNLVQQTLGQQPTIVNLAHAGAYVARVPTDSPAVAGQREALPPLPGEVPNPYPTVWYQLKYVGPSVINPANVDVVFMEGCLHDVGYKMLLDPKTQDVALANTSLADCTVASYMIDYALYLYPRARVFVVGYPRLISPQTDAASLNALATLVGVAVKDIELLVGTSLGPLVGIPPDPLIATAMFIAGSALNGASSVDSLGFQQLANRRAALFDAAYLSAMDAKITSLNQQAMAKAQAAQKAGTPTDPLGPTLVWRITAPFDDSNGFAAPNSYLWSVPTTQSHDDAFAQRQALCDALVSTRGIIGLGDCLEASAGYPNRAGAAAIISALTPPLTSLLLAWKAAFGPQ